MVISKGVFGVGLLPLTVERILFCREEILTFYDEGITKERIGELEVAPASRRV